MDWQHIRSFHEIAACGSFVRAASNLGLTQPALSRHMFLLQKELGFPLIEKNGRHIRLTEEGVEFLERSGPLLTLIKDLSSIKNKKNKLSGEFVISTGGTVAACILPGLLSKLRIQNPDLSFRVIEGDAAEIKTSLLRGEADLGIITGKLDHKSLNHKFFFTDEICVVALKNHPLTRKRKVSFDDLSRESFVMFHPASAIRQTVEKKLHKYRWKPHIIMELQGVDSVRSCIEAGLGLGFLSTLTLSRNLKVINIPELTLEREFYFCSRKDRETVQMLIEMMEKIYRV